MTIRGPRRNAPRSTGGIARHRPGLALGLTLALVLLAALFTPLAGAPLGTLAAPNEPAEPQGTAFQEDGTADDGGGDETPVTEETPDAAETPDADLAETPDAGLESLQADPYLGRIIVFMRECDLTAGLTFQELDSICWSSPQIEFEVYGGGVLHQSGVQGYLDASGLPGGNYTIREFVPQGYTEPTVFCSQGAGSPRPAYTQVLTVSGYFEVTLGPSEAIACHWFNVRLPSPPHDYGKLYLYKLVCPVDPAFNYFTADQPALSNRCTLHEGNELTFNLYSPVDSRNQARTINPDLSEYAWLEVEGGPVTVTEHGWTGGGTPVVFCTLFGDGVPIDWFKADISGATAAFDVATAERTACHWFTVPGTAPVAAIGGVVTVSTYTCDDITATERDHLLATCEPDAAAAAGFALATGETGETGETENRSIATVTDGAAAWTDVPAGGLTVTAPGHDGAGDPAVFCAAFNPAALVLETVYTPVAVNSGAFAYELGQDDSLTCDWFAAPASEDGDVSTPKDDDVNDPADDDVNGQEDDEVVTDAEDQDQIQDLNQDDDGPDGGLGGAIDRIPEDDGDGSPTTSGETGSITVYEWLCPAGFDLTAETTSHWLECAVASESVGLAISGPDGFAGPRTAADDSPGGVSWDGLDAGDYLIDDTQADGDATGVVLACHGLDDPTAYPLYSTASGDPLTIPLADGQHVACLWFTVPAADQATDTGTTSTPND